MVKRKRPLHKRRVKKRLNLKPKSKALGLTYQGKVPIDRELAEVKIYDNSLTATINSQGTIVCVNGMAQQVYNTTRIGNRIHMKYMHIKYTVSSQQIVNNVNAMFRLLVVYDKESNGTIAPITNGGVYNAGGTNGILDSVITTGNATVNCLEQYYFINKQRYVILYDKTVPLIPKEAGVSLLINQTLFFEVRIPLNTYTEFSTGSAGFANIAEGAVLVAAMSDQLTGGGTNIPSLNLNSRIFFTDN